MTTKPNPISDLQLIADGEGDAELMASRVMFAVAELVDAATDAHDFAANVARNEAKELDRRFYRLREALARFEVHP